MKNHIFPALKLSALLLVLFVILYPLTILAIAQLTPHHGDIVLVKAKEKVVGVENIGQTFDQDRYFNGRPSAVNYNAAASGGSNKGPSNPAYLAQVEARIDTFLVHNPSVQRQAIPSELVTASGSGLDPNISPMAAFVQMNRIAQARHLPVSTIRSLVEQHIQKPVLGLFGPSVINVLALNIALDKLPTTIRP